MKDKYFTKEQVQAINDRGELIRLWAQAKISPSMMTKTQLGVIKNFCKEDIDWFKLTGSK